MIREHGRHSQFSACVIARLVVSAMWNESHLKYHLRSIATGFAGGKAGFFFFSGQAGIDDANVVEQWRLRIPDEAQRLSH